MIYYGKNIKITVTHDLSGKTDSITLYTYTKKGKVTITPAGPVEMPINPNTEQEFKVTKIGNNYSGNVEWKIIDEQSPNVYLDLTDDKIKEFYEIHGREEEYKELNPGEVAYYDSFIELDLSEIRPMIAMPFHPSNTYRKPQEIDKNSVFRKYIQYHRIEFYIPC